jgi:hypothetical protein
MNVFPAWTQVASVAGIVPGMWVRLFMPAADNTRRRRLLSEEGAPHSGRKLRQVPLPSGKVTVLAGTLPSAQLQPEPLLPPGKVSVLNAPLPQDGPIILDMFADPALQTAMEAAVRAQWATAAALETNPDKVRRARRPQAPLFALA